MQNAVPKGEGGMTSSAWCSNIDEIEKIIKR